MMKKLKRLAGHGEEGQSLVLLAFALLVVIGATAMSVDVGRAYWAKTQVQAAVDAAALAGAAGLPDNTTASAQADQYWNLNNGFLRAQGRNVTLTKSFTAPPSKEIQLTGSADIDTWFAPVFGIDSWHVSASASAEYQKVDAMLVLDRSGSMCYDSQGDGNNGYFNTYVRLRTAVNSSTTTFSMEKIHPASGQLSSYLWVGQRFQLGTVSSSGSTNPSGGSPDEWMQITGINNSNNTITVQRARSNPNTGSASGAGSHSAGHRIIGTNCAQAGSGPYLPWQYVKNGGSVFVNNMNSLYDQIGYVYFASTGILSSDFTSNYGALKLNIQNTLNPGVNNSSSLNGDNSNTSTNIAHGIWYGVNRHITSSNKRADAFKAIILLSDGAPNKYCTNSSSASTQSTSCNPPNNEDKSTAKEWSRDAADYAKSKNVVIYTISYGSDADVPLMQDIADRTGGKHYEAPNEAALNAAFQEIAQSTHVKMTR